MLAPEEGHFGQITYFDDVQVLELLPNTMDTDDASLPTLSITVDGTAEDWLGLSPVLLDENDDSLLPNELELLGVYASRDDEFIYVLFEGVDAFSKSIERSAALRFLSPSDESCEPFLHEIAINVAGQVFSHNDPIPLDFASSKSVFLDVLEFRIPFSSVFYEECQFFEISTAWINSPELGSWEVMDSVP